MGGEPSTAKDRRPSLGWIAAVLALVLLARNKARGCCGPMAQSAPTTPRPARPGRNRRRSRPRSPPRAHPPPPEEPTGTAEPTTEPSTGTDSPGRARPAMQAFVQDSVSLVTSDPESTFAMLTPEFQAETRWLPAGTRGSGARSARRPPYDIQVDPEGPHDLVHH